MHTLHALSLLCLLCLALTGCVRAPQPVGYPYSEQQKMQAAHHWNVLANDVANRINSELLRRHYENVPVFVSHSCGKPNACGPGETFAFDEGFNDLLTTQLVNFGVPTKVAPDETALVVDYKVQVLYHQEMPRQVLPPGMLTALTTGIMVFRDAPTEIIAIATAAAIDLVAATATTTGHYEVIITTSIAEHNQYLFRTSDIYYINDADFWQYQKAAPAPEIDVISTRRRDSLD